MRSGRVHVLDNTKIPRKENYVRQLKKSLAVNQKMKEH